MDSQRVEKPFTLWGIILIIWALYRVYAHFPEWVDELFVKPLVFVGPIIYYVRRQELKPLASLGLVRGHFFRDLYMGLGFGMLFALEGLITNAIKHGTFSFVPIIPVTGTSLVAAIVLAIATAISEETLVRGFLFTRLKEGYVSEVRAMMVSTAMYFLLLVPAIFLTTKLTGVTLIIFIMTTVIISFANTMIFNETKTLTVPILIHAFWNMAVALYL